MALMPDDRRGCACCAAGAASWTCRWTARRSSTRPPIAGLYLNGGWCYGGFKATPASGCAFAHLIAKDEPSDPDAAPSASIVSPAAPCIDEKGMGAQTNLH